MSFGLMVIGLVCMLLLAACSEPYKPSEPPPIVDLKETPPREGL